MSQMQWWQQSGQWQELYRTEGGPLVHTGADMKFDEMIPSKYLKQSDIDGEVTVTVAKLEKQNVAREDEPADYKYTVSFSELPKPLVLNATNIKRMAKALGDDTDDWTGGKIKLYIDPDIEFGGKIVGGIRVRGITFTPTRSTRPASDDDVNRKLRDAASDNEVPF